MSATWRCRAAASPAPPGCMSWQIRPSRACRAVGRRRRLPRPPQGRSTLRRYGYACSWFLPYSKDQSVMALAPRDEAAEDRAGLEVGAGGVVRRVTLHALADGLARRHIEAGDLALMPDQRSDLPVDGAAHVHDDLRLVGAPEPQLAHLVRLEALPRHVLGEV